MATCKFLLLFSMLILSHSVFAQDSTKTVTDTSLANNATFSIVEKEAYFPGGEMAWRKFLEQNLNANTPVDNGSPVGMFTVFVQFIVAKDGTLSDIKALTKMGWGMENEVMRIIRKSGLWVPAEQSGRLVKAYRKQPVTFVVQAEDFEIQTKVPYTLFAGVDNEITVNADKVKKENLQLTISQGKITPAADGTYTVRVSKPGRVIITIFNTKKNKNIGEASFEVKENSGKVL